MKNLPDHKLKLRPIKVHFLSGSTDSGTAEGNNAAWKCDCERSSLDVATSSLVTRVTRRATHVARHTVSLRTARRKQRLLSSAPPKRNGSTDHPHRSPAPHPD